MDETALVSDLPKRVNGNTIKAEEIINGAIVTFVIGAEVYYAVIYSTGVKKGKFRIWPLGCMKLKKKEFWADPNVEDDSYKNIPPFRRQMYLASSDSVKRFLSEKESIYRKN